MLISKDKSIPFLKIVEWALMVKRWHCPKFDFNEFLTEIATLSQIANCNLRSSLKKYFIFFTSLFLLIPFCSLFVYSRHLKELHLRLEILLVLADRQRRAFYINGSSVPSNITISSSESSALTTAPSPHELQYQIMFQAIENL